VDSSSSFLLFVERIFLKGDRKWSVQFPSPYPLKREIAFSDYSFRTRQISYLTGTRKRNSEVVSPNVYSIRVSARIAFVRFINMSDNRLRKSVRRVR